MQLTNEEMRERFQHVLDLNDNVYDIADIVAEIKARTMQIFSNEELSGCCITQVVSFPRKKVLQVIAAFGTMEGVMSLQPQVVAFGKEQGCDMFYMQGRPGWKKVLPNYGWTPVGGLSHFKIDLKDN